MAPRDQRHEGRRRRPRHSSTSPTTAPLRRPRHQRHLARGPRRRPRRPDHHRHRRRPAPDVGGPVLQARHPALAHHLRRSRHDGFALPAAIGAKSPARKKTSGSSPATAAFQMTAAELSTIVQEKLAINIAVINNGFLGMVRQWRRRPSFLFLPWGGKSDPDNVCRGNVNFRDRKSC